MPTYKAIFLTAEDNKEPITWPERSIYDSQRWGKILRDGFNCKISRLSVFDGNKLVAYFPITFKKKGVFLIGGSPLRGTHTEFGGSIEASEQTFEIMQFVNQFLNQRKFSWFEFSFAESSEKIRQAMQKIGYTYETRESSVVNLRNSPESLFNQLNGSTKRQVRKALRNELRVEFLNQKNNVVYMRLVEQVYKNQRRKPSFQIEFLDSIYTNLKPSEFLHCGIFKRNELIAGALFFIHSGRLVFVSGASNEIGKSLGANSLLQWFAIEYGCKKNFSEYDLGGMGIKTIDRFKKGFGGEKVLYDRFVYSTPLASMSSHIYKLGHSFGLFSN